ncbi:hypothetical protein Taro_047148 [Colocasia esculenta]|uniref:Uncharacterized protein n=1 Tax=Colocasia esculenta TaxID=4460 RepID=A0A843X3F7_COLES|nr:hypothetical protein [Colocasia esculenta]
MEEEIFKLWKYTNQSCNPSFFPSYNRTPKHHGCLNTLHRTLGTSFRTCWGRVEKFLVARELWINHKKLIFFPVVSAAICTNHLHGVELSTLCQYKAVLDRNPRTCPFSVDVRHRPCERDSPIGRVLGLVATANPIAFNATKRSVATLLPDLTAPSHSSHNPVAFSSRPVATLTRVTMKIKRKSKSRMGMRPSDELSNY